MSRPLVAPRGRLFRLLLTLCSAATLFLAACGGGEVQLAGTVERTTLELAAPSAELVTGLPVEAGDRVRAGQVVVQLDTAVADAELRATQASREAAEAGLTESEGEFARTAQLRRSGVSTQQSLDSSRRRRDEARATAAERDARIAQAQKRRDDLTIRTPVDGVVDQVAFELGERVPAGGVVAVVLSDETPWVRVWMPASAVAGAGPGTRAEVKVEGTDEWLPARVRDVAREPEFTPHFALTERESEHLVYEARVALDEAPDDLRPGLPAQVRVRLNQKAASPAEGEQAPARPAPEVRPEEPPEEEKPAPDARTDSP
jgi:HlyD family secretion protein